MRLRIRRLIFTATCSEVSHIDLIKLKTNSQAVHELKSQRGVDWLIIELFSLFYCAVKLISNIAIFFSNAILIYHFCGEICLGTAYMLSKFLTL